MYLYSLLYNMWGLLKKRVHKLIFSLKKEITTNYPSHFFLRFPMRNLLEMLPKYNLLSSHRVRSSKHSESHTYREEDCGT